MLIRALDANGDWTFGQGIQNFFSGLNACQENLQTRLKEWVGNCFWSLNSGVDYNNYLDIGTKNLLDLNIQRVILQSDGVIEIVAYTSTLTLRQLNVACTVQTVFGQINFTTGLGV